MHLVAWVREIWDTRDLSGDVLDERGRPRWKEWEGRFDPEDLNALEMALQIKDRDSNAEVTAISVGTPRKTDVLRESLYRGVNRAVRVTGGDQTLGTLAEARMVAAAVQKIGSVDVLFTGIQLNEGENAQRGGMVARLLGWPLASYVESVEKVVDRGLQLRRAIEGGVQILQCRCPAVVSVGVALMKEDPRAPRSAKAKLKLKHKKTAISEWRLPDLDMAETALAEPVRIRGYRRLEQRRFPARHVDGTDERALGEILEELQGEGLVR